MVVRAKNRRWQESEKDDVPLEKLTQHFKVHNRTEGESPRTVECYSRVLSYFRDYLKQHKLPDTPEHLDITVVRDFILYLQSITKWQNHPFTPAKGNLSPTGIEN